MVNSSGFVNQGMSHSRSFCFLGGLSSLLSDSGLTLSCRFFVCLLVLISLRSVVSCMFGIPKVEISLDSSRVDWMERISVRCESKVASFWD